MGTNLPASVFVPTSVALFFSIFTSIVPRRCLPGGSPIAAMASVTSTIPEMVAHLVGKKSLTGILLTKKHAMTICNELVSTKNSVWLYDDCHRRALHLHSATRRFQAKLKYI